MFWTEERTAALIRLWNKGVSATEISREIGAPSRSSVLGKVHRLNLEPRDVVRRAPRCASSRRGRTTASTIATAADLTLRPAAIGFSSSSFEDENDEHVAKESVCARHGPVALFDLRLRHCRWPIGDPRDVDFGFCGEGRDQPGSPYCAAHRALAFDRSPRRQTEDERRMAVEQMRQAERIRAAQQEAQA